VFHFVRQVKASGCSILFIGHNIHHVYSIADRFVVLDRGNVMLEANRADVPSAEALIAFMEDVAHPRGAPLILSEGSPAGKPMTEFVRPKKGGASGSDVEPEHRGDHPLRRFVEANRAPLGTLTVFVVMMAVFLAANPRVFSEWNIYRSVLTTLPVALFLVVPLVFVVTAGEIDLSFPATMGFSAWMFALVVQAGFSPYLGIVAALATGMVLGLIVGLIVVYFNLSSLVATLGMNFMLRGVIQIVTEGKSIAFTSLNQSSARTLFSSVVLDVPTQMFWGLAFVVFAALLYNHHRFGAQVKVVGDNPDSASQMGVNVNRVRVKTFVFVGLGAALAGIFSTMINFTWWPTSGDGYLLPALASVFVGGTPTWGGVGTVVGGAIGALIVSFIQTGIVGAGLSGFYVQFFNGLIIILSLIGHRWNQIRYR
jgi:simple sugar transport system permease protein